MATPDSSERFIGLEWLRFLLGLYVVVYHTLHTYPKEQKFPGLDELTSLGFFATSTFFVLSGFLLAHVYARSGRLRESARSFWTKRLSNLYPLHLFSLLLSILVLLALSHLGIGPELDKATPRFVIYDTNEVLGRTHPELFLHWMSNTELFVNSILQILLLQAWNPYYLTFNAPLWSLSTLMFFYLAFPFVAPAADAQPAQVEGAGAGLAGLPDPAGAGGGQRELRDPLDRPAAPQSVAAPAGIPWRHPGLRVVPRLPRPWHGAGTRPAGRAGGAGGGGLPGGRLPVHPGRQTLVLPAAQRPAAAGPVAAGVPLRAARRPEERFRPPLVAAPGGRLAVAVRPACADVHPVLP